MASDGGKGGRVGGRGWRPRRWIDAGYREIFRRFLGRIDPERAHEIGTQLLRSVARHHSLRRVLEAAIGRPEPHLVRERLGLRFPGPVGLAGGFDKNGWLVDAVGSLGFGFLEVGSVTARPGAGNPRPRIFRLPLDRALVNRVGLPSDGARSIARRLRRARRSIPVGVNLAKTPDREIVGEAAVADYLESYRHLAGVADFVVLNVSCPNTSDGTTFEEFGALDRLLEAFALEREGADRPPPLLVKYSLESTPAELVSLSELGLDRGVDGFVVGNTVRGRPASLESDAETIRRAGRGGLSGAPLLPRVVERLRVLRQALGSGPTLIGVGGLLDAPDAGRMIDAGADLVEIYSGLVYEGPNFPARINRFLAGREGSR